MKKRTNKIIAFVVFIFTFTFFFYYIFKLKFLPENILLSITFAFASGFLIYYTLESIRMYFISAMEDEFLNFLRDLADAIDSGLSMPEAFKFLSKGNYGILTKEIKKVAKELAIGEPFPKVMKRFVKRLGDSEYIKKAMDMILTVYYLGGNVSKAIRKVENAISMVKNIEKDKEVLLKQQVAILYIIHFTSLGILIMIFKSLLPLFIMAQISHQATIGGVTFFRSTISLSEMKNYFFLIFITMTFSNGILAGFVLKNKLSEGLKHVSFMLLPSLLLYFLFIYPPLVEISVHDATLTVYRGTLHTFAGTIIMDGSPLSNWNVFCQFLNDTKVVKTDDVGKFACSFEIPVNITPGKYTLKIYFYKEERRYERRFEVTII